MTAAALAPLHLPTPVEVHDGVAVKREDAVDAVVPNGKMRGVLPYFAALRASGVVGVVNAGASHSNSHAIAAHAGALTGLLVYTLANTSRMLPNLQRAADLGGHVRLNGPSHLQPLRAAQRNVTAAHGKGWVAVPWGLAADAVVDGIAQAVAEVTQWYDLHVVPLGAGTYTAAVWRGLLGAQWTGQQVVGVSSMGLRPSQWDRVQGLCRVLAWPADLTLVEAPPRPRPTPWPSDRHYEWGAWEYARQQADLGQRVLLWSVGASL